MWINLKKYGIQQIHQSNFHKCRKWASRPSIKTNSLMTMITKLLVSEPIRNQKYWKKSISPRVWIKILIFLTMKEISIIITIIKITIISLVIIIILLPLIIITTIITIIILVVLHRKLHLIMPMEHLTIITSKIILLSRYCKKKIKLMMIIKILSLKEVSPESICLLDLRQLIQISQKLKNRINSQQKNLIFPHLKILYPKFKT